MWREDEPSFRKVRMIAMYQSSGPQIQSWSASGLLCVMVFAIAIAVFMLFVWGTIFKKAGYSPWFALLMIIPIANLVWILIFAFSTWPIQRELEAYRLRGGYPPTGFPVQPPRQ